MLVLNDADVRKALPMGEAIEAMKVAFAALSDGRAEMPLRTHLSVTAHEGATLVMPAYVRDQADEALAIKVVSVFSQNTARGLPTIHGAVLVLAPDTGRPLALLDGATLTAIRTGAASGLATSLLARPDSKVVAIFGAGAQARTQLEAVCTTRRITTAWVYGPQTDQVKAFIAKMAGKVPMPLDLRCAASPRQALVEADIICTATTSSQPVFADTDLKLGVHINGVGSYLPTMQELPAETIARAMLVVDSRAAVLAEAGDLTQPIEAGLITAGHVHAELGEIVLGRKTGRTSEAQMTLFKSVGVAVQDAVAAHRAVERARQLGLGQEVSW